MGKHIVCSEKEVASNVIVCGDPERARFITSFLEERKEVYNNREFWVGNGYFNDKFITICSTGIGGASMAIAVEELIEYGAKIFVRVGSCGVFQDDGKPGDIFIATGAIRHDGVSSKYLPLEIPCVPDFCMVEHIKRVAEIQGVEVQLGIGSCSDVYYKPFKKTEDIERKEFYRKIGVLFGEMENSTLFSIGMFHKVKTASVLVSDSYKDIKKDDTTNEIFKDRMIDAINLVLMAITSYKSN